MEWMPIESAPKDKSVLLLMGGKFPSVGQWDSQPFNYRAHPYWRSERGHIFGKTWDRENQPTHWMPLPEPPKEKL